MTSIELTENQFSNLYRFIKANQHQNKELPEIVTVFKNEILNRFEAGLL